MALIEVDALSTLFPSGEGDLRAVDGLSFAVQPGETVAIVGESGSGKSVTVMSIMRLLGAATRHEGAVRFEGRDLLALSEAEMRKVRGNRIGMIFQEPMTALNPVQTIGSQIAESLRLHRGLSRRDSRARALEMLSLVGIPAPERRIDEYPHQLSGGMRQRVMIAMALACDPALLIADEPTTALDVTVQAQILDLIREQARKLGAGVILITHDLGVVAELADRVIVVYAGRKVEEGTAAEILDRPRHPYTRGLLEATPRLRGGGGHRAGRMTEIPGNVPGLAEILAGCAFEPRCAHAQPCCRIERPPEVPVAQDHLVVCRRAEPVS
ncbi:ABC transporter ATP-binding protein [Flavisphingomonas formosensis]|uniref:ABC transporter ATP-binding protein n=1 Tax=Flavisphingomonas formosensis TaxID=861534 RepID=UPI0012FAB5FA|nr:ABC transporter ATP-binding protein [Sphingomonas formosensis]